MQVADQVRQAVADLAATPMQMTLEQWQAVSRSLLGAADEIDRLTKLVAIYETELSEREV